MTLAEIIGLTIVGASLSGCVTFATLYWAWFPWWRSPAGRNLFAFVAVDGLINLGFVVSVLAGAAWKGWAEWLLVAFYILQPGVVWWRVALLVKVRRGRVQERIDA